MLNLFALRATDTGELYKTDKPVGSENDDYLKIYLKKSEKVIYACVIKVV